MTKKGNGVTLIELLIVVAIMGVLVSIAVTTYSGVRSRKVFEGEIDEIVADLRLTMSRSLAQEGGEQWGVHFGNPAGSGNDFYEVWNGLSYASGTIVNQIQLDVSVALTDPPSGGTKDVIFSKSTGLPTASFDVELMSISGNSTATIDINTQGRINLLLN